MQGRTSYTPEESSRELDDQRGLMHKWQIDRCGKRRCEKVGFDLGAGSFCRGVRDARLKVTAFRDGYLYEGRWIVSWQVSVGDANIFFCSDDNCLLEA